MRPLLALALLLITGCGYKHAPNAMFRPEADLETTPKVVFIGDDVTAGWDVSAQSALYINKGVAGQTSDQILARFQADVISLHPDVVHIIAGTNDIAVGWNNCGNWVTEGGPTANIDSCANIDSMVTEAQNAGIKVVLGTIPPNGLPGEDYGSSRVNLAVPNLNAHIEGLSNPSAGVTVVDYCDPLQGMTAAQEGGVEGCGDYSQGYGAGLTTNGIDPDAAGYAVMLPLAQQSIEQEKVGGDQ